LVRRWLLIGHFPIHLLSLSSRLCRPGASPVPVQSGAASPRALPKCAFRWKERSVIRALALELSQLEATPLLSLSLSLSHSLSLSLSHPQVTGGDDAAVSCVRVPSMVCYSKPRLGVGVLALAMDASRVVAGGEDTTLRVSDHIVFCCVWVWACWRWPWTTAPLHLTWPHDRVGSGLGPRRQRHRGLY
jgi:hypothetical protein